MDIYKNQQDRTEIQNQYEHELRQYEEISSLSVDSLLNLGFTLENPKSVLKRFKMQIRDIVLHGDVLDNRVFIFYLDNKHVPNVSTTRDLINLINLFK